MEMNKLSTGLGWPRLLPLCAEDRLASEYLTHLENRGYSSNTTMAYGRALEAAIGLYGSLDELELNKANVVQYIRYLRSLKSKHPGSFGQPLSPATIAQRVVALRAYANYLVDSGLLQKNPVTSGTIRRSPLGVAIPITRGLVPMPRTFPQIPNDRQWASLLNALSNRSVRDRLMFVLAYDGALRRNELVSLQLTDLDYSARILTIRAEHSKNGSSRVVPYSQAASQLLQIYLPLRRKLGARCKYVFVSESPRNKGNGLSGYTWGGLASKLSSEAKISFFSTHTLRHLRLTDLARAGFDLKEIATFAGHRSLESTMKYIHMSGRELARAFARSTGTLIDRFEGI